MNVKCHQRALVKIWQEVDGRGNDQWCHTILDPILVSICVEYLLNTVAKPDSWIT